MIARYLRPLLGVALAAAAALGFTACSVNVSVPKDQVAQQISEQLAKQVGQRPDSVNCPEDLPATVGASVRCTLKAGSDSLGVTATVTSVDGTNVKFNVQVDQTVTRGPATPSS